MKTEIAIIGVSMQVARAGNLDEFWKVIADNKILFDELSGIRKQDLFDRFGEEEIAVKSYLDRIDLFDNDYFKISPAEAERMDPEQRLMLEAAVQAVQNAGYLVGDLKGSEIGVFHTFSESGYKYFFDEMSNLAFTAHMPGMVGTRIANFMDWRGPVIGVETTCSSSLAALYYACESIASGDCTMAMAAGINLEVPYQFFNKSSAVVSKKNHCLPFDKNADGTLAGEGVFCFLLKGATEAIKDGDPIHAIIKGGAINHGGALIQNISAPSPVSQTGVIKKAWINTGTDAKDVRFIEAHGTGTILGDPIEFEGLRAAFSEGMENYCTISSVKGQLGHLNSAAGLAGLARLIVAIKHRKLLPQMGFRQINPHISEEQSAVKVQRVMEEWKSEKERIGGISSYGLTGTNVHLVIKEYNPPASANIQGEYFLIVGADNRHLAEKIREYLQNYIVTNSHVELSQLCYTTNRLFSNTRIREMISFTDLKGLKVGLSQMSFEERQQTGNKQELFLLVSSIFREENMKVFLKQHPILEGQCERKLTEATRLLKLITQNQKDFIVQYCAIKFLISGSFTPDKIIGGQSGKLMALLLSNSIFLDEALNELDKSVNDSFNSESFAGFLSSLNPAVEYRMVLLGESGDLQTTFKRWLDLAPRPNIQFLQTTGRDDYFFQVIKSCYNWGVNIHQDLIIRKALFLNNFYPPVFNKKRFWPAVTLNNVGKNNRLTNDTSPIDPVPSANMEDIEERIREIWREKLKLNQIDPSVDFFDIGGSSLLGLDILDMLARVYQVELEYPDIFDYSTVESQACLIRDKLSGKNVSDLAEKYVIQASEGKIYNDPSREHTYRKLVQDIDAWNVESSLPPQKILITGGTGFLGAYLIKELLLKTSAKLYCLVRAGTDTLAEGRLFSALSNFLSDGDIKRDRVFAIKGDITVDGLDMSKEGNTLTQGVDAVYHLAASVKHYAKKEELELNNFSGTIHILEWTKRSGVKKFNYYSTSAIASGTISGADRIRYLETDLDLGQDYERYVYPNSKFKAEQYIISHKGGLQTNIFRIGNVGGDSISGLFQENIESNGLYQRLKAFCELGLYCDELGDFVFDTTPVDIVTQAIVELSLLENNILNVFHIEEPDPVNFIDIVEALSVQGIVLKKVDKISFLDKVNELIRGSGFSQDNFVLGLAKFAFKSEETHFELGREATDKLLEKMGMLYSYDKSEYIATVIQYCIEKGFIKFTNKVHPIQ